MTAIADFPAAHHDRSAYHGRGGAGTGPAAVSGPVVPMARVRATSTRSAALVSWWWMWPGIVPASRPHARTRAWSPERWALVRDLLI